MVIVSLVNLDSASLIVADVDGNPWVAPNLVLHYITVHGYVPPPVEMCDLRDLEALACLLEETVAGWGPMDLRR